MEKTYTFIQSFERIPS